MSYEKQAIARNTVIQTLGKALSTLLGLASFTLIWRFFGPENFGTLTIAMTFLGVFATFVDFGLTLTTTQLISEHRDREQEILGNLLSLRLISAGVFLGSAPFIAFFFPYSAVVRSLIAIGVFSYYSASISQMLGGVFQKNLDMLKPMIAENLNRFAVLLGIVSVWFLHGGLTGVMWVFVIGNIVQLGTILVFTKQYAELRVQLAWPVWKLIIGRSWPIGASIFFNLIYLRGDVLFLSIFRSNLEIGLYGTAYKIIDVVASLPVMYMGLVLPILVRTWTSGEKEKFNHALQDGFDFFTVLGFPIAFGLALVGRGAVTLVAGPDFADAGPVLWILGPALLCVFYGALFGHAIVGLNKQRVMTWTYAAVAIVTILGYILFIPRFGMYGAAFWTLMSEGLIALMTSTVVLRVSGARIRLRTFNQVVFSTAVMALAVNYIPAPHVLVSVAIGALAYAVTLSAVGGPSLSKLRTLLFAKELV